MRLKEIPNENSATLVGILKYQVKHFHLPAKQKFPRTQPCTLVPGHSSLSKHVASALLESFFSPHTEICLCCQTVDELSVCPGDDVVVLVSKVSQLVHCIPPICLSSAPPGHAISHLLGGHTCR